MMKLYLTNKFNKLRISGIDDLPQKFETLELSLQLELLESKFGEICLNAHILLVSEIVSDCQYKENSAILTVNGYTLSILWPYTKYTLRML